MIAIDTSVLLYAYRAETPRHVEAYERLRALAEGEAPWAVPAWCLVEFVRVATDRRIFRPPSTLEHALSHVERLLESPSVRVLAPGPAYRSLFARACREGRATGNLCFGAAVAALCIESGVSEILTEDRDLSRYPGLRALPLRGPKQT